MGASVAAWNSALQCESRPDGMRDFFVLSYQVSVPVDPVMADLGTIKELNVALTRDSFTVHLFSILHNLDLFVYNALLT